MKLSKEIEKRILHLLDKYKCSAYIIEVRLKDNPDYVIDDLEEAVFYFKIGEAEIKEIYNSEEFNRKILKRWLKRILDFAYMPGEVIRSFLWYSESWWNLPSIDKRGAVVILVSTEKGVNIDDLKSFREVHHGDFIMKIFTTKKKFLNEWKHEWTEDDWYEA